ncbi:MAG TPA: GNAT family N-acetyltransferase [Pyrinomonadaceae bacterium]|jgi:GNAT superfamily N-acetyltransferase|nr:GNAT family N-acetyltransferase [Pyrinomonadaceae bacterium]
MKLKLAYNQAETQKVNSLEYIISNAVANLSRVQVLTENNTHEVLGFLKMRPVHTVVMTSFIQDNGIENPCNRGKFYSYRNAAGELEGVALIGHTTLVEARSDDALITLALKARESETPINLMMSDGNSIESFWQYYSGETKQPRLVCEERLFEIKHPVMVRETVPGLRLATAEELMPVAVAHAEVAFEESGVNPMEKDRDGYLKRVLRRIEQGRVWVVFNEDTLVFKADVIAETAEVMYLEGIYVNAENRGKGIGANCLSQLSRVLLEKVKHVCLLSNVDFQQAHNAYLKAGFKSKDCCVTMFV